MGGWGGGWKILPTKYPAGKKKLPKTCKKKYIPMEIDEKNPVTKIWPLIDKFVKIKNYVQNI